MKILFSTYSRPDTIEYSWLIFQRPRWYPPVYISNDVSDRIDTTISFWASGFRDIMAKCILPIDW